MAKMKIRCTGPGCKKKISVDEAFAGGVCRCPYCKAIVLVESKGKGKSGRGSAGRPSSPSSRPDAPTARPDAPMSQAQMQTTQDVATKVHVPKDDEIPMANPVKIQGIVTMLMIFCLLLMVGLGIFIANKIYNSDDEGLAIVPEIKNPFSVTSTPAVAGDGEKFPLTSPVYYLVDCGNSMNQPAGFAARMIWASIKSLKPNASFNAACIEEGADRVLSGSYLSAGEGNRKKAEEFLTGVDALGATDLGQGIVRALEKKPKTLVIFAGKELQKNEIKEIIHIANLQGTKILTFVLWDPETGGTPKNAIKSLKIIADRTKGASRDYDMDELVRNGQAQGVCGFPGESQ